MKWLKQNKRTIGLWCLGLAGYLVGLFLLTALERSDPNASIKTIWDALWYSVVTLSTVGYGDLYPVTVGGKVLGIVFVLLSVGLLTFVISLMIRIFTGKLLPAIRLWRLRSRNWYLFSAADAAACALMQDLKKADPEGVFLVPGEQAQGDWLCVPGTMETVAGKKQSGCHLFYMGAEYEQAQAALALGHPVYCMTSYAPDSIPEGLTLFDRYDCCARSYWHEYGVGTDRTIVLIGSGAHARQLLVRGLLLNVAGGAPVCYHMFGDWTDFCRSHYCLDTVFAVNADSTDRDSLHFHSAPWNADAGLLKKADRILLCGDDFRENLTLLGELRTYFPTNAALHLLHGKPIPGETVFGMDSHIYTGELVMRCKLTQAARTMHQIYRSSTGNTAPVWEQLSEFLRQSNIAAAEHLLTKTRLLLKEPSLSAVTADSCRRAYEKYRACTPEQKEACRNLEHRRWMVFHALYNWTYAPVRDNGARQHPLMIAYEQLSLQEQQKDDYAWEMLGGLAEKL